MDVFGVSQGQVRLHLRLDKCVIAPLSSINNNTDAFDKLFMCDPGDFLSFP